MDLKDVPSPYFMEGAHTASSGGQRQQNPWGHGHEGNEWDRGFMAVVEYNFIKTLMEDLQLA